MVSNEIELRQWGRERPISDSKSNLLTRYILKGGLKHGGVEFGPMRHHDVTPNR